ncbi:MAG: hypothetical protein KAS17_02230 [Victivallaceae bacterium]|nr:hypothetical protein [Victivallaceae bacterium]
MLKNITWGISFSALESEKGLPSELPECFSLLELPGFLLSPLSSKQLKLSYPYISELFFRDMLDPTVSREIITQSTSIQNDLKLYLQKLIGEANNINSSGILLDFAIERSFENPDLFVKIRNFISSFSNSLYHSNNKLLFPVRVPLLESVKSAEQYLEFLKNQMLPQAGFSIDIHPHELAGKDFSPQKIMQWLEFDTVLLRFVYEPETGNRLVSKSIEPWIEYSRRHCAKLKIVFAPVFKHLETAENEINLFEQLISSLNNP